MMKEELMQGIFWLWREHRGASLGVLLGLGLGISVLVFGFWRTLFVTICCLVGLWLGRELDTKANILADLNQIKDSLANFLLPRRFRRFRSGNRFDHPLSGHSSYEHFD